MNYDYALALILDEESHARVGDTGECLQGCSRCEAERHVWQAVTLAIKAKELLAH